MMYHLLRRSIPQARGFGSSSFLSRTNQLLAERTQAGLKIEEVNKAWLARETTENLPEGGIYKHPYCTIDKPLSLHGDDMARSMMQVVGPEHVSPHFNSIEEFGKWFNYFFVGLAFTLSMRSHQNHAFGYCVLNMMFGLEIWLYTLGIYMFRASVMIVPNPWKSLWRKYNIDAIYNSVYENEENIANERRQPSLGQVEYLALHKEYFGMKAELMDAYVKNSRLLLKKHTYDRTINILKATERFEQDNLKNKIKSVLTQAVEATAQQLNGPEAETIRRQALNSALKGIRKGQMAYDEDPLLPLVLKKIDEFKVTADKMTQEELSRLVSLTPDQKTMLKSNDEKAEESFVKALPPLKHPKIINSKKFKELTKA
mmetsp:Transcript_13436/g.25313  ORF Transcript_13436/g.25313 Transcript_13436/m.25313 type:complete len:371 (+) Transcript_13436:1665-2777(+)